MKEPTMEDLVHEALDNARLNASNDYYTQTPNEMACDLTDCCATFEGVNPYDLEPHIKTWLVKNR